MLYICYINDIISMILYHMVRSLRIQHVTFLLMMLVFCAKLIDNEYQSKQIQTVSGGELQQKTKIACINVTCCLTAAVICDLSYVGKVKIL